jgi:hypothetical protein
MAETIRQIRSPVRRKGAERYVLLSLVSFAVSVIGTRTFLQLTGYPQIGNSELHIAHVLWGGLLLFIASLLPLILANRWAYNTAAILSGVGVGLFIDEVGKFITQTNDYFYPPAAPIIYAFFLLTVMLYVRVRRPPDRTPRAEMYRILEEMTEVLDCDLNPAERDRIEARLVRVSRETSDPNLKQLAGALYAFVESETIHIAPHAPNRFQRFNARIAPWVEEFLTRPRLRVFLIFSLGIMGVLAMIEFSILLLAIPDPAPALEVVLTPLVTSGELRSAQDALWFLVRTILEGSTGILLILSGALIVVRRERFGLSLATVVLVIWLTVINLLVFYLDQFGAVITALFQFFVLMLVTYYRRRYLFGGEE